MHCCVAITTIHPSLELYYLHKLKPFINQTSHVSFPSTATILLCLWISLFLVPLISGLLKYLNFCVWLISLYVMFSRFVFVVACVKFPSFALKLSSHTGVYFNLLIHNLLMGRCIAIINMSVQITLFLTNSTLGCVYADMQLLNHIIIVLMFWETAILFSPTASISCSS